MDLPYAPDPSTISKDSVFHKFKSQHNALGIVGAYDATWASDGCTRIFPSQSGKLLDYLREYHSHCYCGSTRGDYFDRSNDNNSGDDIVFDNEEDEEQHQQHQQNKTKKLKQ